MTDTEILNHAWDAWRDTHPNKYSMRTAFEAGFDAAKAPRTEDRLPNDDEVICPNCTHQFRAIPVNVQAALAEQPAAPAALTDAEIEAIYQRDVVSMIPGVPVSAFKFARAILAAAIPPGHCVVKDEPVAWMFEYPDKRIAPKFDSAPHGGSWKPLYAARPGEKNE